MALLGSASLVLALAVCAYGIGASLYGVKTGNSAWSESGRRSVYALAGVLTVAFAVLEVAFLRNDFAFNTVADTSSMTTPTFYRAAAVWSSQEGSLLLWAWLLSLWSTLVLFLTRKRMRDVSAYATAILLGFGGFFISLMVFYANPFKTTDPAPSEGVGLDPLLRHPSMMIHPPMLYSGYTLCIVPLAFGMGALFARKVDAEWIKVDTPLLIRRLAVSRRRNHARRALVLLGARLGRLLGLGRGRERLVDALVDRNGLHPLADDPGEARDAEGVERVAGACHRHARDHGHIPRAQRDPQLDSRVRRTDTGGSVRGADRSSHSRGRSTS